MHSHPARAARRTARRARRGSLAVELLLAALLTPICLLLCLRHLSGGDGVRVLEDAQVGVRLDRWSGAATVLDSPGAHPFMPFLQEVQVLDRRPVEYVMSGDQRTDANHVPRLDLRARDGATFGFEHVVVQYTIDVDQAPLVLADSGPSEAYKAALVDLFAGPSLRAAFGRYTTSEVLVPANRLEATMSAKAALQTHLARHGITVLDVGVSKPSFAPEYETVFKRRLVADQDTAALRRDMAELEAGHPERMAHVGRIKASEREIVREAAQSALEKAQLEALRGRAEADRQFAVRVLAAGMERTEKLAKAGRQSERHREEAAAFRARIEDLAARGESAVRAALVERLATIRFDLEPRELWPAAGTAGGPPAGTKTVAQTHQVPQTTGAK